MQNKKPIWKSEINSEIRNQFGNQKSKFRNHGDLKSRTHNSEGVGPLGRKCNSAKYAFFHPRTVLSLSAPSGNLAVKCRMALIIPCSAAYFPTVAFCSAVTFK